MDFPLDQVFGEAELPPADATAQEPSLADGADASAIDRAAVLLRDAERPVIMAGAGLYWGRGETALRELAEALRIPVFLNGLARGCLSAVAAELRPETRYDQVVEAFGCHGELVASPGELRPALERALASGRPVLVNVLTDPAVAYPRKSALA